ncbi:GHKL domain-containing protein [Rathayibacter sp. AY1C2]|uniref:GHKL domain-containing protein n=1 Tax=Rathayibacter sp. AY1C2 TaxID=2080535 RepID=UPI0035BE52A5
MLVDACEHISPNAEISRQGSQINDPQPELLAILDSLAGLIRHETEPSIGFLRRSAARDLGINYAESETFRYIELLRLRLRGLETLTSAHRFPKWERVSLNAVIRQSTPEAFRQDDFELSSDSDQIDTDPGLLSIILGNALLNAREAADQVPNGSVWVSSSVTDRDFSVAIRNNFAGQTFDSEVVARSGLSSKPKHKGLGVTAMHLAAKRLEYSVTLNASGGTAMFAIRGARYHG